MTRQETIVFENVGDFALIGRVERDEIGLVRSVSLGECLVSDLEFPQTATKSFPSHISAAGNLVPPLARLVDRPSKHGSWPGFVAIERDQQINKVRLFTREEQIIIDNLSPLQVFTPDALLFDGQPCALTRGLQSKGLVKCVVSTCSVGNDGKMVADSHVVVFDTADKQLFKTGSGNLVFRDARSIKRIVWPENFTCVAINEAAVVNSASVVNQLLVLCGTDSSARGVIAVVSDAGVVFWTRWVCGNPLVSLVAIDSRQISTNEHRLLITGVCAGDGGVRLCDPLGKLPEEILLCPREFEGDTRYGDAQVDFFVWSATLKTKQLKANQEIHEWENGGAMVLQNAMRRESKTFNVWQTPPTASFYADDLIPTTIAGEDLCASISCVVSSSPVIVADARQEIIISTETQACAEYSLLLLPLRVCATGELLVDLDSGRLAEIGRGVIPVFRAWQNTSDGGCQKDCQCQRTQHMKTTQRNAFNIPSATGSSAVFGKLETLVFDEGEQLTEPEMVKDCICKECANDKNTIPTCYCAYTHEY